MRVPERSVQRAFFHKLRLRADRFYFSAVHESYHVRVNYSRKAVCNDDERFSTDKLRHTLLNDRFVFGICIRGGFIEDNDGAFFSMALAMEIRCFSPSER